MTKKETSTAWRVTPFTLFTTLLTVLFIGLKLAHIIDWSWWWVLLPLYAFWGLFGGLYLFAALLLGIAHLLQDGKKGKKNV